MLDRYDLAVSWDWEQDREFVSLLEKHVHSRGMRFYSITHHNTHETLRKLHRAELMFGAFLDRAWDLDENFAPVARAIRKSASLTINPPEALQHAADKATMHLEFLTKGIEVPFTIIISPYNKKREVELSLSELARLGRPFIIKPANTTGGGIGVILGAETLKDVVESRQHHKNDKYLLQEKVVPVLLDGKVGWFRVFFIFGTVLPCWWDHETHLYSVVTDSDMRAHRLDQLCTITRKIHEVCHLDFFSTEIAIVLGEKAITVDYVNEICDMRLQSIYKDGVPDHVVAGICQAIADHLPAALH
jgi:glutathione synthase/RimK-type ligase-like ATP-grasp enzyme